MERDLRTVHGTLRVPPGVTLTSPLPLPLPEDDLTLVRTFPGAVNSGEQSIEAVGDGVFRFTTRLPHRWGTVGTSGKGLYALGGFHPQPLVDGAIGAVDWVVDITLPPGRAGLVGQELGSGTLHWEGRSERVALAVPRRARTWSPEVGEVVVLANGRPRRVFTRQLEKVLPSVPLDRPVVVVEAPMRRRLAATAPGVLFASDRFFQVSFPFVPYHRPALVEGLAAADTLQPHPQLRELVGRAYVLGWEDANTRIGAVRMTRAFAWVPSIDDLLSSRRMAFYGETFRTWNPTDPLLDDVVEHLAHYRHGSSVAAQLELRSDREHLVRVGRALDRGMTLPQALQLTGLDPRLAPVLTDPAPAQDYVLATGAPFTVTREAESGQPEMLEVRVDRSTRVFEMRPGETVSLGEPSRVVLDPGRRVEQASRTGDAH
ncbi:MAG: hypothetical protein KC656_15000, partial [Myxococcales bacterium]|nr:hypothetical protein [Myxococcales bacterium]